MLAVCDSELQDQTRRVAIWTAVTTFVAVVSLVCFTQFPKGQTISVGGQLAYCANFVSMLVCFVLAQTIVFSEANLACQQASS